MARRRNTVVTALFTYGQSTLGMVLGLLVTRVVLRILGKDIWGLWAASGALLAYAGLADLGVLRVLVWVVVEADGRKDHDRLRASLSSALPFACFSGVAYVLVASTLWHFYPGILHLSPADQAALRGPVFTVVLLSAATFPLRLFTVLLTGLQDATFLGTVGLVEMLLSSFLTFGLAWGGFGLYALAIGTALPPILSGVAALARTQISFRSLVRGWPKPARALMSSLGRDGIGLWLAGVGFQLAAASDPIILAYCGLRAAVAGFVLTVRLPTTLLHLGWILPDSALVGLGQLFAEGNHARSREVVLAILRLHMIIAGAAASAVLAANAGFIRVWVGADLYLGPGLNALAAANVVMITAIHGLTSISAIFGGRVKVGIVVLANGALHILIASILGRSIGVNGVAAATFLSAACTAFPVGLRLLEANAGVTAREVLTRVYWPWLCRFTPLAIVAFTIGRFGLVMPFPLLVMACSAFGVLYLFWMKPLYVGLPLGARLTGWLNKLRLLPPSAT